MFKQKLVSVIVPVYNCERYLTYCLNSIVNQTYQNIEVILIDDESKDRSGEICDTFATKYSYIKVIHQKNKGCGFSRNEGLNIIKGDYFTYIDADDYVSKYYIEKMLYLAEENAADVVTAGTIFMLETRNQIKNNGGQTVVYDRKEFGDNFMKYISAPSWGKLYRHSTCGKVRYDRASYEDVPYANMMRPLIKKSIYSSDLLYVYRAYQDSITRGNFGKKSLLKIHKNYKITKDYNMWCEEVKKAVNIVIYRNQEELYSTYLKKIYIDIIDLKEHNKDVVGEDLITIIEGCYQKSNCGLCRRLFVKIKHVISTLFAKVKVKVKYNVKID